MKTIRLKITGISSLLMRSDRYANPLDEGAIEHKKLTSKKKKTDEDHLAIMESEWRGSLYCDDKGPYIAGNMFKSCLINGAKFNRLGATFGRSIIILEDKCYLEYDGPKTPDKLWKDGRFRDVRSVVVSRAKLMRTRPLFEEWAFTVTIHYDENMIEEQMIVGAAEQAGQFIGLGDYRPDKKGNFGRFEIAVI